MDHLPLNKYSIILYNIHFLLWRRLPSGLESNNRTTASNQTRDSEGIGECGLTCAWGRQRSASLRAAAHAQTVGQA